MKTLNILIGRLITKRPTFLSFISQSPATTTKLHQIFYEAVAKIYHISDRQSDINITETHRLKIPYTFLQDWNTGGHTKDHTP